MTSTMQRPVRRAVLLLLSAATAALALAAAGRAHVTIEPPFVEIGVPTEIAFQTPNERTPHVTTLVRVTAPPGITLRPAPAPPGWSTRVSGTTVTWTGGKLEGRATVRFPVEVEARVRAGTHDFSAIQRYDDGASVTWKAGLSVLPATGAAAPGQHPYGAVAAAVVGLLVIGLSLLGARRLRRASLQEK